MAPCSVVLSAGSSPFLVCLTFFLYPAPSYLRKAFGARSAKFPMSIFTTCHPLLFFHVSCSTDPPSDVVKQGIGTPERCIFFFRIPLYLPPHPRGKMSHPVVIFAFFNIFFLCLTPSPTVTICLPRVAGFPRVVCFCRVFLLLPSFDMFSVIVFFSVFEDFFSGIL